MLNSHTHNKAVYATNWRKLLNSHPGFMQRDGELTGLPPAEDSPNISEVCENMDSVSLCGTNTGWSICQHDEITSSSHRCSYRLSWSWSPLRFAEPQEAQAARPRPTFSGLCLERAVDRGQAASPGQSYVALQGAGAGPAPPPLPLDSAPSGSG